MKPRRVVMQAFGPFADREVIDFTRLPDRSLFLIHGKTGSGKTTVLDAMSFALFGQTSGQERDGTDMRSHHAAADCLTEVVLEFSLGPDHYRVQRIPRQDRPRLRGEGTTEQSAEAEFHRIDKEGAELESIASGTRKVSEAVIARLHFDAEQFRQVVVLPQGRFRDLLAAKSDDRQKILETLFQTARYRRIERALKDEAAGLRKQVDALTARIDVKSNEAATHLDLDEVAPRSAAALKDAWLTLDERLQAARSAEAEARKKEKRADAAWQAGQTTRKLLEERAEARTQLAHFEAQADAIAAARAELAAARRAVGLVDLELEQKQAVQGLTQAEHKQRTAAQDHQDAAAKALQARESLERLQAPGSVSARDAAEKEVLDLEARARAVAELADARSAARKAAVEAKAAHEAAGLAAQALTKAEQARDGAGTALAAAQAAAAPAEEAGRALAQAHKRLERHAELAKARASGARAENDVLKAGVAQDEARAADAAAQSALVTARTERDGARASLLARTLEAGCPCPVCGSREHPAPAAPEPAAPDDASLERLEANALETARRHEAARSAAQDAEQARTKASELARGLERELGAAAHAEQRTLEADLAEAQRRHRTARDAEVSLDGLSSKRAEAAVGLGKARDTDAAARARMTRAHGEQEATASVLAERSRLVPADLREEDALERRLAEARGRRDDFRRELEAAQQVRTGTAQQEARTEATLKAAQEQLKRSQADASTRSEAFAQGLAKAGFENAEIWKAALRDAESMHALETRIAAYGGDLKSAGDRLRRAEAAAMDPEGRELVLPDLEALLAAREEREASRRAAEELAVRLDARAKAALRLRREIEADSERRAEREERYGVVGRLARVAEGGNASRLSFQRFVLASRLEEVLEVASVRLAEMTNGRYTLERRVEAGDQRRAGGLEIDVNDNETGRPRPARTLSGGEGFLAALALSLATADVVQRHAGGIHLDAIFVDEGFGSLDDEALDRAIRTLISLHEDGRLVGVISHVPELRERIDVRLEVVRGDRGSRTRFVLP